MIKVKKRQANKEYKALYDKRKRLQNKLNKKLTEVEKKEIKKDISEFIKNELKLELSDEKTLITKATDKAKFLGFDIRATPRSNHTKRTKAGIKARNFGGHVRIEVATSTIQNKLTELGALRIKNRKTLVVCKECFETISKSNEE